MAGLVGGCDCALMITYFEERRPRALGLDGHSFAFGFWHGGITRAVLFRLEALKARQNDVRGSLVKEENRQQNKIDWILGRRAKLGLGVQHGLYVYRGREDVGLGVVVVIVVVEGHECGGDGTKIDSNRTAPQNVIVA